MAIGSIEHGTGVTCLSLAISNFLCSKLGKKTAYVELNATNQICSLSPGTGKRPFSYMGITIFPGTTHTSLPEILRMDFDFFILDMGVLNVYTANEFARYDRQFLVGSLSKWKRKHTLKQIEHLILNSRLHRDYLLILGNDDKKESKKTFFFEDGFRVCPIPFIPNPFRLDSELFSFFEKILGNY
jgi:hypothetical protein